MKSVSTIMILFLLAAMASCGKDNKSGRRNGYGLNSLNTFGAYGGTSIAYQGVSLQQIVVENRCANGAPDQYRSRSTLPAQVNTPVVQGDIYVGVTSFGDVAVLVGTPQGWVIESYICPRGNYQTQVQSAPYGIVLLPYSRSCRIKQMNANLNMPDGTVARFGTMDLGTSAGTPFSMCRY